MQTLVEPLQPRGNLGARHYDLYPWELPIPEFDRNNADHTYIAALGAKATAVALAVPLAPGLFFRTARTQIRRALGADGVAAEIEEAVSKLLGVEDTP